MIVIPGLWNHFNPWVASVIIHNRMRRQASWKMAEIRLWQDHQPHVIAARPGGLDSRRVDIPRARIIIKQGNRHASQTMCVVDVNMRKRLSEPTSIDDHENVVSGQCPLVESTPPNIRAEVQIHIYVSLGAIFVFVHFRSTHTALYIEFAGLALQNRALLAFPGLHGEVCANHPPDILV